MAGICAVQAALTLADSEVSIHLPQIVSFDMAPKKRSEAQLAAAARGTSTKKNKAATGPRRPRLGLLHVRHCLCTWVSTRDRGREGSPRRHARDRRPERAWPSLTRDRQRSTSRPLARRPWPERALHGVQQRWPIRMDRVAFRRSLAFSWCRFKAECSTRLFGW
jgi:hypothetical protein